MSNFDEFEKPIGPEKDTGSIISHAFENYKNIIGYAILFVIISFLISTGISLLFPGIKSTPSKIAIFTALTPGVCNVVIASSNWAF